VVIAAALLFVLSLVLNGILFVPFAPLKSSMSLVAGIISCLVTSIIVGYVFAEQIREESRLRAIGSILTLTTAGLLIFLAAWFATPLASPAIKDSMQSMFHTSGWTDYDWFAYSALVMALDIVLSAVLDFVGLYVGSMLKPKKT
jgi:hypothetical protein